MYAVRINRAKSHVHAGWIHEEPTERCDLYWHLRKYHLLGTWKRR